MSDNHVHEPDLGWWAAQLEGGPHDGQLAPLSAPYPMVDVPEGRYRRRDKPSEVEGTTLVYVWQEPAHE